MKQRPASRDADANCPACEGGCIPCKGGGNKGCHRRHAGSQHIAIILDSYGGARTIVGTRKSIRANARHDELVRVVPGLVVHEPIAWNDIPIVIERARVELLMWLETRPNLQPHEHEAVIMYRLRCLQQKEGFDLSAIAET